MTDVLFTNVPLLKTCIGGLCPSLTFMQLGTWLQARGHRVTLHDVAVDREIGDSPFTEVVDSIAERVVQANPAVLGVSCKVPADGRFTRKLVDRIRARRKDMTIVVGGIWASACPREILDAMAVDAVVVGEGEHAITAICDRIDRGLAPLAADVPGAAWRGGDGGGPIVNPGLPPVDPMAAPPLDLGLMPCPDQYTVFPYLTSKGCPYTCTFCSERLINPRYLEVPLDRLTDDIHRLVEFGRPYYLWMSDPLFGARADRLEAICRLLEPTPFEFLLESRVDVLRPEHIGPLSDAGCELIYFGFESAAYESLRRMQKVRTEAQHARYLRQTRELIEACMIADVTPIFGVLNPVPGDGIAQLQETYGFLQELKAIADAAAQRSGTDPGYHFYAFDYRFIRGTTDFARLDALSALGATWAQDPTDIFRDVVITDASPEVPRQVAADFQRRIRELVHTTPTGWMRLQRSFPSQPLGGLG